MSLEDYRYDIEMCLRCSSCKWVDPMWCKSKRYNKICPISSHFHFDGYSCQGLMDISLAILEGEIGYTTQLTDILYHCTLCGACDVMCKRTLDTERLLVIEELRRELVRDGKGPGEALSGVVRSIERCNNPFGAAHDERFSWLDGARRARLTEGAKMVYFVGCAASYRHTEIAEATVDILDAGGVQYTVMGDSEWCCGNPLLRSGLMEEAREVMRHQLETLETLGAETVVTSCAECYHVWKVDYPRLHDKKSLGYEVLHSSELLADLLKRGALKFSKPVEMTVTYHDSCRLGRLSEPHEPWAGERIEFGRLDPPKTWRRGTHGVYFQPREVLRSIPGLQLVEMERARENAFCCGAGGGVKWAFNDFALATGAERLTEAVESGARALVSACPYCKWNFADSAAVKGIDLEVLDIMEITSRAL